MRHIVAPRQNGGLILVNPATSSFDDMTVLHGRF